MLSPQLPPKHPAAGERPRPYRGAGAALTHSAVPPPSGLGGHGVPPAGPAPAPRPPGHRRDPAATFAPPRRRASRRPHPPRRAAAPAQPCPAQPGPGRGRGPSGRPRRVTSAGGRAAAEQHRSGPEHRPLPATAPRTPHPPRLRAGPRLRPVPAAGLQLPEPPAGAVTAAAAGPSAAPARSAGAALGVPWAALGREARPARESRAGHGRGAAAAARRGARGIARRRAPEGPRRERGVGVAGAARRRHAGAAGGGGDADRRRRLLAGEDPGGDVGRVGPGGGAGQQVLGERPVPQDVAGPAEGGLRVAEAQRLTPALPAEPALPLPTAALRDLTWSSVSPQSSLTNT